MLVTRTANNISTTNVSYTRAIIPCKTKKYWFLPVGTEAQYNKRNNSTKQKKPPEELYFFVPLFLWGGEGVGGVVVVGGISIFLE